MNIGIVAGVVGRGEQIRDDLGIPDATIFSDAHQLQGVQVDALLLDSMIEDTCRTALMVPGVVGLINQGVPAYVITPWATLLSNRLRVALSDPAAIHDAAWGME